MRPAVAVVDDASVIRESIAILMSEIQVVAAVPTVEELMRRSPPADLVVLDLHLANAAQPDVRQGIAAIRALTARGYRVCVYSQEERRFVLAACIAAGAHGIVSKSLSAAAAQQNFVEVAGGGTVIPHSVIGLLEVLVRRKAITVLTERQRQVLHGRARGFSYGQLARHLFTGESTLRGYWKDITETLSDYLTSATPAEIEHALGLAPGDLLEFWPDGETSANWWRTASG
ncbi:MAG TPA: response regulator [Candidatus Limnocylindrales bacterium]